MKFFRIVLLVFLFISNLVALSVSSNDNYKVYRSDKFTIIYTDQYKKEATFFKENLNDFFKHNDKSFGYSFDEPIKIVLISNKLQIPNAFSTPIPYNMGVYFNGGSSMSEYFSMDSWLITLFTHEMIHNYQMNAKKSKISQTLHKYLGNNYAPIWAGLPFFTIPNIYLPTALIEGDAVLNESIYNNGGRLYNGRFNALKNSLVFGNKIDPTTFINDHINFPYTNEKYIVGGFYMQYLSSKYGIDRVNSLFYNNSIHSINPFLLNNTFRNTFNISFEQSVRDFVHYTKNRYKSYKELPKDNIIVKSKAKIELSKIDNNIYFITTNLVNKKQLNIYDIDTNRVQIVDTKLKNGKIFKIDNKLYSKGSDFISSTQYKFGLFDKDNYPLKSTIGKSIEDIHNNHIAYVDIKSSFLTSKLFIDDRYYSKVNSSALFDKNGDIYYFKQIKDKRVLYKNKTKLYSFKGYYSKLIDIVDNVDNSVYFIANSKNGATIYRYEDGNIYRLNSSDNIINGKIIDKNNALVVSVTKDGYDVQKIRLDQDLDSSIAIYDIDIENNFEFNRDIKSDIQGDRYNELKELEFSSLYPSYTYDSQKGSSYLLNAIFIDPIMFNMLNLYIYKDQDDRIEGLNYINERYIPFNISLNHQDTKDNTKQREVYGSAKIYAPIYQKGRDRLDINLKKYYDQDNTDKEPTLLSLDYTTKQNFPLEFDPYLDSDLGVVIKEDRGDITFGVSYMLTKHIYNEFYISTDLKYIKSDTDNLKDDRGVKVISDILDKEVDSSDLYVEGIDYDFYVKDISKVSLGLSKTLYFNHYFSTFPISLRRESIFTSYSYFRSDSIKQRFFSESILGVKLDLLVVHKFSLPLSIKLIKNELSKDDYKFTITAGVEF